MHINDLMFEKLVSVHGYTGAVPDMLLEYWRDLSGSSTGIVSDAKRAFLVGTLGKTGTLNDALYAALIDVGVPAGALPDMWFYFWDTFDGVFGPPAGVSYVADGDSNSSFPITLLTTQWPNFTIPAPIQNNALGNSRLTKPGAAAPLIDRIPGDIATGCKAIAITWGGNDIYQYLGPSSLDTTQCLSKMKEDLLDISKLCVNAGVALVIPTLHYLGDAYDDNWNNPPAAPWNTNQVAVETLIDALNAWINLVAGPLTWTVVDVAGLLNDIGSPPGDKKMLPGYKFPMGGSHWNETAAALIGPIFQAGLASVVTPEPKEYTSENPYSSIRVTDYQPSSAIATIIEWDSKQTDATAAQCAVGTFGPGFGPNFGFQWQQFLGGNLRCFFPVIGGINDVVPVGRALDVEYFNRFDWPAAAGNPNVRVNSIIPPTSLPNRGAFGAPEDFIIGAWATNGVIANRWKGVIKNVRVYEGTYLVHDIPVNEGVSPVMDLVTGLTFPIIGTGSWS